VGHKPWDRAWRRADKARERNAARAEALGDEFVESQWMPDPEPSESVEDYLHRVALADPDR